MSGLGGKAVALRFTPEHPKIAKMHLCGIDDFVVHLVWV